MFRFLQQLGQERAVLAYIFGSPDPVTRGTSSPVGRTASQHPLLEVKCLDFNRNLTRKEPSRSASSVRGERNIVPGFPGRLASTPLRGKVFRFQP